MVRTYVLVGLVIASTGSDYLSAGVMMSALGGSLLALAVLGRLPVSQWARMWRMPERWVAAYTKAVAMCLLATGVFFFLLAVVESGGIS
jgi:hypothetical protein